MMEQSIQISKILDLLPHRYPLILIDRILSYVRFETLTAIKNVTVNEPFFPGHFPGNPIMPGVLMVEALAQASAILSNLSRTPPEGHEFVYYFAGIDKVKFKHVVIPGDQLELRVKLKGVKYAYWRMHGEAYVGEKCVCTAELLSVAKEVPRDQ